MTKETLLRANELNNEIHHLEECIKGMGNKTAVVNLFFLDTKTDKALVGTQRTQQVEICLPFNKEIRDTIIEMYKKIIDRDQKELEAL